MRVVLFLGAGFSKPAGFPLMREFRSFAQQLEGYETEKRCLWGAVQYAQRACAHIQGDINNIEDIMSALSLTRTIDRKRRLTFEGKTIDAEHAMLHLATLVWRTYLRIHDTNRIAAVYGQLFKAVRIFRDRRNNRVDVVTTNYDMLSEILLGATGTAPAPPAGPDRRIPDARPSKDGPPPKSIYSEAGEQCLHKLHGSANWFRKRSSYEVYYDDRVTADFVVATPDADVCVPWCTKYLEALPKDHRPLIVPPSFLKAYTAGAIRDAWKRAEGAIKEASRLVFIGYSFPPSDTIMKFFLGNALAGNRPGCAITVIDRNTKGVMESLGNILVRSIAEYDVDPIEAEFQRMIGKGRVFENPHEFANYLGDMTIKSRHMGPRR